MKLRSYSFLFFLLIAALSLSACVSGSSTVASGFPGLTIDKGTAFLADRQQVYAINIADGTQIWRYPKDKPDAKINYYAAPTLTPDGTQLVVGTYVSGSSVSGSNPNLLTSLDPTSGTLIWSFNGSQPTSGASKKSSTPGHYIASTLVVGQNILAPNENSILYTLDMKGTLVSQFQAGGSLWATPVTDPACDCVYQPSMDHKLYSINFQTGKVNWTSPDLGGPIAGTPALSSNGVLYVGTFGGQVLAIDAKNGQIVWKFPKETASTPDWVWGGPVLKDDRLYFGVMGTQGNSTFYAVNTNTGESVWKFPADGRIVSSSLVTDDSIYFTTEAGTVYAVDLNGAQRWNKHIVSGKNQAASKLYTSPESSGDLILIATTGIDELVVALDKNGEQKWTFIPPPAAK